MCAQTERPLEGKVSRFEQVSTWKKALPLYQKHITFSPFYSSIRGMGVVHLGGAHGSVSRLYHP